jgi:hypothetical protein
MLVNNDSGLQMQNFLLYRMAQCAGYLLEMLECMNRILQDVYATGYIHYTECYKLQYAAEDCIDQDATE